MVEKILVVEDEKDIVEFIQYNLETEGFKVLTAFNGEEALKKIEKKPDLIVLDIMMPKMSGYEVLKKVKLDERYKSIPVLFLTAKSSESDEIAGLELGADDYITKPVSIKKLVARIKSNLRMKKSVQTDEITESILTIGDLTIDREQYVVYLLDKKIVLPRKEFEILNYLAAKPGKVFPRSTILQDIWGPDVYVVDRTIDVHIRKLREKLGEAATLLEPLKGVGYRFKSDESA